MPCTLGQVWRSFYSRFSDLDVHGSVQVSRRTALLGAEWRNHGVADPVRLGRSWWGDVVFDIEVSRGGHDVVAEGLALYR